MYLLDSNLCVQILRGMPQHLVERVRRHAPEELVVCSVVRAELLCGVFRSQRVAANLELLRRFLAPYPSLPFDDRCAEHYAVIRAALARQGRLIGANDLLIAATALAHRATLVTHNVDEFSRVEGIVIEDWEAPGP